MPKGHSQLQDEVDAYKLKVAEACARIAVIEARLLQMDEYFARGYLPCTSTVTPPQQRV